MSRQTVAVQGGQLHVLDEGHPSGPPVLLLHAGIADLTSWDASPLRLDAHPGPTIPLVPPTADRLADLRCPILAVAGALDASEVAQTARHLEAHAPNARAVILPDGAHMIAMEAPDRLAALVVDFLARGRPGS